MNTKNSTMETSEQAQSCAGGKSICKHGQPEGQPCDEMRTMKQMQAAAKWDNPFDKTESEPPVHSTIETSEQAQSCAGEESQPLTDEQLLEGGLIQITAFVRSEKSKAALRKMRQREKEKAQGLGQLNITAPVEFHDAIKQFAAKIVTSPEQVTPAPTPTPKRKTWLVKILFWMLQKLGHG